MTNIDHDHMDTYGHDFNKLKDAFVEFLSRLPFYGVAVLCVDDENVRSIIPRVTRRVIGYGLTEAAEVRAIDIRSEGTRTAYTILRPGHAPLPVVLNLPGLHNVTNSLAAVAVATLVGVDDKAIVKGLSEFTGVGRRFAQYGQLPIRNAEGQATGSFTLVDDYGHHPHEIEATIAAVHTAWPEKRLLVVFQPHRYTRTRDCFEDFVNLLCQADAVVLADVYPASEAPLVGADGRALAHAVRLRGQNNLIFCPHIEDVPAAVHKMVRDGDVVLTIGAGSVGRVPAMLVKESK